ncbi:MAG TPA: hypothetical protein VI248_15440 [Kineosporiaceae bacterium]
MRRSGGALTASQPSARAGVFAGTAVTVSLAGHVAMGGSLPDTVTTLVALAAVALGYRVVLAGRERSWAVLAGALMTAEAGLHWLFLTGPGGVELGAPSPEARTTMAAMPGMATTPGSPPGLAMLAGHLAAALVLAWFLRQGEQALWAAARRSGARVARCVRRAALPVTVRPWTAPAASPVRPGRPWASPRVTGVGGRWVSGGRSWRAPPVAVAVA